MKMKADVPLSDVEGEDLFPSDEEKQRKLVSWVEEKFSLCEEAKAAHVTQWEKHYKMYRSYIRKRKSGEWRSRAWMPIAFYVIETIIPRLVAQLPELTVNPVGPEDVAPAENMEELLHWAQEKSDLEIELVKALKSALIYGTGILKVMYEEREGYMIVREPVMQQTLSQMPMTDMRGMPMTDMDGNPMTQEVVTGVEPTGEVTTVRRPFLEYAGPRAEAVDIANFFVDPIADDITSARYVIHRVYRDRAHLESMYSKGVYHRPPDDTFQRYATEHAALERQSLVELGPGGLPSGETNLYPILEVWTDDFVVTTLGTKSGILLRAERNPFAHGEKPFVVIRDHLVPHEFWGIGELEPLEGLQDVINALWNSRIDNVKLVLNTMLMATMDYIEDPADLTVRPGGVIRTREGIPPAQAVAKLDFGDVTASSYNEVMELERMTEKVSGVDPITMGQESAEYQRTATGIALTAEQANTRFTHKIHMAELTGFKHLARQYAAILQQFMPDEMVMRVKGQNGVMQFRAITQDSVVGRFDFDVEAESSAQTESIRKEQTLSLFQMLAADPYMKPFKIREDVLKTFGRKDTANYMYTPEEWQMLMQQQAAMQAPPAEQGY